jgi:hypothetical protein
MVLAQVSLQVSTAANVLQESTMKTQGLCSASHVFPGHMQQAWAWKTVHGALYVLQVLFLLEQEGLPILVVCYVLLVGMALPWACKTCHNAPFAQLAHTILGQDFLQLHHVPDVQQEPMVLALAICQQTHA